jgi:hypothetical protein
MPRLHQQRLHLRDRGVLDHIPDLSGGAGYGKSSRLHPPTPLLALSAKPL